MGKIAVVTGSTRGIGLAIGKALIDEGYSVIFSGTKEREYYEELAVHKDNYVKCDIAEAKDRENIVREVVTRYGKIDLWVNNAGVASKKRGDILELEPEDFDWIEKINLKGTLFMTQLAAKAMIEHKKNDSAYTPRIINISSISAYTSSVSRGDYCIVKAGISMVTKLFADRLAEYGIPVFEVRPGIIKTDMTSSVQDKYIKMIDAGLTPIKRMGTTEDVAGCVCGLAGGGFDFATGQVINADGGFHIRRL